VKRCLDDVQCREFQFSEAADEVARHRYEEVYNRPAPSEVEEAATSRSDQHALRLSMLLAVAEGTVLVEVRHVEAAWAVVDYSNAVVSRLVKDIEVASIREAQARIEGAIQRYVVERRPTFTKRDIYQRLKGKSGLHSELFNRLFDSLVAVGLIAEGVKGCRWTGGLGDGGQRGTATRPEPADPSSPTASPKSPIPQSPGEEDA
jgi:hypothetical protein